MNEEVTEVLQDQSYEAIKGIIRGKLSSVAESFVSIGYRLKQVRDGEMYKADGYSDIWEFAEKEFNLSRYTATRFMSINDKYSVEGNSLFLLPQYAGYGWSKLSEMLTLTDEQLKLVTDRTTRVEIREIKKLNDEGFEEENETCAHAHKTEESLENTQSQPQFSVNENYRFPNANELLTDFFRLKDKRQVMKDLTELLSGNQMNKEMGLKAAELINPSGHLMYRKGMAILMFEEDHIKYNKFGGQTTDFTYLDLLHDLLMVFDMSMPDPWVAFYGEPEPDPIPEPVKPKVEPKSESKLAEKKQEPMKDSKPASKPEEKKPEKEKEEAPLPGQIEIEDYPEVVPEQSDDDLEEASWQQDPTEQSSSEPEEYYEVVEADIVHSPDKKPECNIDVKYDTDTGEIEVYMDCSKGVKLIRVIDTSSGESWEVDISQ